MTMGYGNPQVTPLVTSYTTTLTFLLILCLLPGTLANFRWETSDWGICYKDGCGEGGEQTREIWCMYMSNKVVDNNCLHLIKPDRVRSCFKPCSNPMYEVKWAATAWSDCLLDSGYSVCSRARGVQTRRVSCVNGQGELQDELICNSFRQTKLPDKQKCDLQCNQDCIVGEFSEWSSCDDCRFMNKTRIREVVVPEANGGKACPAFTKYSPCSSCGRTYFIVFTPWSICESFQGKVNPLFPSHPLIGAQERNFECIDIFGRLEDLTKCMGKFQSAPIVKKQACIIAQDCVLSEWSSWDLINSSCVTEFGTIKVGLMVRYRTVKQIPLGSGQSCGKLVDYSKVSGSTIRPCPRTKWIVSTWSSCQKVNGLQQCSRGLQYRNAVCIEENEEGQQIPIDDSRCLGTRPMTTKTCRSDCNWDCTVSIWTPWTDCQVTECDSYARKRRANQKTGQRYRTREMLTRPGKKGLSCPHLSETQNCDPEPCYKWKVVTGSCQLRYTTRGERCGAGEAQRTITCLNRNGEVVENRRCEESQARPNDRVLCNIPCANDCVLSEWREWSECPDICQQDNKRRSYVQKRTRTILAKPPTNIGKCPPRRDLEEFKNCPTIIECATYIWNTDPWGECILNDKASLCGPGKQRRGVACFNTNRQPESDKKCTMKVKPDTEQSCDVPCPKDCRHTNFSAWSPCSATCKDLSGSTVPTKERRSYILRYPENGGAPCKEVLREVVQCSDLPHCNQYNWETLPWSDCVLPKESCGRGLMARNVTCRSVDGNALSIDICLRFVGQMPPISKPCYVSCDDECLFTDWSEWSQCLGGCGTKRFRQRVPKFNPDTVPPAKCSNINLYPRYEQDFCHFCDLTRVLIGEWSQCILEPPIRTHRPLLRPISNKRIRNPSNATRTDMDSTCGTGKMYKVVACKANNAVETADKCTLAEYEEDVCVIPCPVDCKMSEWSQWSECPTSCGAGIQERYRHIQEWSSDGGRQCPNLDSTAKETQTRLCHPECSQFTWKTFEWNMCIPMNDSPCGHGQQSRSISCVTINANGFTTGIVDEGKCITQPRPENYRDCYLPCPGDCVVTDWTEWSQCPQTCSSRFTQTRTRQVMREASVGFAPCPALLEEEACIKGKNCMEYHWELSEWTSCLVNYGLDDCGAGHKERFPICKNHLMQTVDDRICLKVLGQVTERLVMSCEISCDVDCLLSEWSEWSSCSKTCGLGQRIRERSIVEQYIGNGRPCPTILTQTKPCFERGCYRWEVSDWSPCMPQKNLCGSGMQTRNVSCVGDDGLPSNPMKCKADLDILVLKTERPCRVPCPGECVITEWSEWNSCFITCEDFDSGIMYGRQSRSRAILSYNNLNHPACPDQLWESRGCTANTCTYFEWKASPWVDGERNVWCESSNGLRVSGGCNMAEKLPTILHCSPQCVANAICNDTNSCACFEDYEPVFSRHDNTLVSCSKPNATGITKLSSAAQGPEEDMSKIWMYIAVAAGTVLIIVVALLLYNMSEFFQSGPRPHGNEKTEEDEVDVEQADTLTREKMTANENCNVCSHIPAPVDTMVTRNHDHTETRLADDVGRYVDAWNRKSFARRAYESISHVFPCMSKNSSLHVHESPDDSKVTMAEIELSECSNGYAPFQDVSLDTESTDVVNLIHTPSYYLATRNTNNGEEIKLDEHSSKILTLPAFETSYLKTDSLETDGSEMHCSVKSRDYIMKRSQSDSAISVPTTNSTEASSFTNSPHPNHDRKIKINVNGNYNPERSRDPNHQPMRQPPPSMREKTAEMERVIVPRKIQRQDSVAPAQRGNTNNTNDGNLAKFMENYMKKMNSPSKPEKEKTKSFKEFEEYSDQGEITQSADLESESDPLLQDQNLTSVAHPLDLSYNRAPLEHNGVNESGSDRSKYNDLPGANHVHNSSPQSNYRYDNSQVAGENLLDLDQRDACSNVSDRDRQCENGQNHNSTNSENRPKKDDSYLPSQHLSSSANHQVFPKQSKPKLLKQMNICEAEQNGEPEVAGNQNDLNGNSKEMNQSRSLKPAEHSYRQEGGETRTDSDTEASEPLLNNEKLRNDLNRDSHKMTEV